MPVTMRWAQRGAIALALGSVAVPTAFLCTGAASAETLPSFDAVASAYGVQITATNAGIPLGLTLEGSGPTSAAQLTDVGVSSGFASFPFPGTTVAGLPGIAGAVAGFPTPAYPLIATSDLGGDPQEVNYPGISLRSASSATQVDAVAVVGQPASGGTAVSHIEQEPDGSVTSTARTAFDALNLSGLLRLSGVESSAEVTADGATGNLTRTASLSVGRLTIPGTHITLPTSTPAVAPLPNPAPGLPQAPPLEFPPLPVAFGGQTVPATDIGFRDGNFSITLPVPDGKTETYALPADVVIEALKQAGITVTFEAAEETETGITAPVLSFAYTTGDIPPNPSGFAGPVPITYLLGRSIANVTLSPVRAADTGGTGGIGAAAGPVDAATNGAFPPGLGTGVGLAGVPGSVPGTPAPGAVPVGLSPTSAGGFALTGLTRGDADLAYLALVVVAVVGAGTGLSLRLLGVRSLWSS